MADIAASVLAKLRNKAKASGISYQQCLQLFVQEEFLRKLSKSGYEDNLILKGGLFIYTLTNFESRATIDVDFLLRAASNSIEDVKELINKVISTPTGNDYIAMTAKGFEEISPQRKYHGISAQIIAQIKNVRVPFNVDIGVGDVIVEEKIKGFDVEKKMSKAESFLSNNMNRLSLTLDFEDEYRPIDLNFGLTDGSFDIYQHQKNNENIHLYEMGSGANWVSCHIALFLSFLRFFATQDNSPMPLVMFFDQPSQVYFPQGNDKDEISQADLRAVNKMYKTIFDEINSIGEDTGILPQIIIVDHVDGNNLECKKEFDGYVRCNWRNEKALI